MRRMRFELPREDGSEAGCSSAVFSNVDFFCAKLKKSQGKQLSHIRFNKLSESEAQNSDRKNKMS